MPHRAASFADLYWYHSRLSGQISLLCLPVGAVTDASRWRAP